MPENRASQTGSLYQQAVRLQLVQVAAAVVPEIPVYTVVGGILVPDGFDRDAVKAVDHRSRIGQQDGRVWT
jgi:hypothetical protein